MPETQVVVSSPTTSISSAEYNPVIQQDRILQFLKVTGKTNSLTPAEVEVFIQKCIIYQLDPFNDEIYPIPTGQGEYRKVHFIISYHSLIKKAMNSGKLGGWCVSHSGSLSDGTLEAHIVIHRKDFEYPYEYSISYKEFSGVSPIWKQKPIFMLEKCVTAIGMRNCFADVMGQFYLQEEIDRDERIQNTQQTSRTKAEKIMAKIEPTQYEVVMSIINSAQNEDELAKSVPLAKKLHGEERSSASAAFMNKQKEFAEDTGDQPEDAECIKTGDVEDEV